MSSMRTLLTLALLLSSTALAAAELTVPAFTAYTLPDAEAAASPSAAGVTRWTDPAISINWYGQFRQAGEITVKVTLRLPLDAASKLRLTVAGPVPRMHGQGRGR